MFRANRYQHLCLECGVEAIGLDLALCSFCQIKRECEKDAAADLSNALTLTPMEARQLAALSDFALASTVDAGKGWIQ